MQDDCIKLLEYQYLIFLSYFYIWNTIYVCFLSCLCVWTETLDEGKVPSQGSLQDYRNLVVYLSVINTAARSNVITNMTVGHVSGTEMVDDVYVIKVII